VRKRGGRRGASRELRVVARQLDSLFAFPLADKRHLKVAEYRCLQRKASRERLSVRSSRVTQKSNKDLRVAGRFQVAEHPGSKPDVVGPPLCRELGHRSCRKNFHPVPIFSSPGPRALPKCTRCFFGLALFSTLTWQVDSPFDSPFELDIESSPIPGRGLEEDFLDGGDLPLDGSSRCPS
jgi:hypothetical protein